MGKFEISFTIDNKTTYAAYISLNEKDSIKDIDAWLELFTYSARKCYLKTYFKTIQPDITEQELEDKLAPLLN